MSSESDRIGIVEADWFGTCDEVSKLVKMIVDKNAKKGHLH